MDEKQIDTITLQNNIAREKSETAAKKLQNLQEYTQNLETLLSEKIEEKERYRKNLEVSENENSKLKEMVKSNEMLKTQEQIVDQNNESFSDLTNDLKTIMNLDKEEELVMNSVETIAVPKTPMEQLIIKYINLFKEKIDLEHQIKNMRSKQKTKKRIHIPDTNKFLNKIVNYSNE